MEELEVDRELVSEGYPINIIYNLIEGNIDKGTITKMKEELENQKEITE